MVLALAMTTRAPSKRRNRNHRNNESSNNENDNEQQQHTIRTIEELRELMPAGASGTCVDDAKKVIGYLDDQMINFVSKSPLIYLATYDATTGAPFVSPKGDEPGFVTVLSKEKDPSNDNDNTTLQHTLVIPDRPGNRLLFGLQNIVGQNETESATDTETNAETNTKIPQQAASSRVSVLFEVPGTGTTLRCGGTARLSTEPALLQDHVARGCIPKLVVLVDIDQAFFHCAKAYMRSRVWDPTSWPKEPPRVTFGQYFAKKDGFLANRINSDIDKHYQQIQKAVDGEACEQEA
jgi:predicted pyridoxine 5'-phosphate oxidase superfamily flavin-nucleotide-binding protein